MVVLLITHTVVMYDAVSNDVEAMYRIISDKYDCRVYAKDIRIEGIKGCNQSEAQAICADPGNLVIYVHSTLFEDGEKLLEDCKARLIIRYQNITPASFFESYNDEYYHASLAGERQTERMVRDYADRLWLCGSMYNGKSANVPESSIEVLAPFHKLHEWADAQPDESILNHLRGNGCMNIIFVGRIAPNKGHKMLLDTVRCYNDNFDDKICLWILGKRDDRLLQYNFELDSYIKEYNLDNIKFIGEISDEKLVAYYSAADAFLCASEHEGFCVPIVEAQYFGLPVIALDRAAVAETLGKNQLIFQDGPQRLAAAIHALREAGHMKYLATEGRRNYEDRFDNEVIVRRFKEILKEYFDMNL